ncbi:AIM24 family protein [Saccharibacillus qingshengii]|uniref:AIM24 family protein n=1 Tax=Saccharibacillus qingshengii TaxID=1763540 RepID=UPI001552D931|nr:AIM24 family protein [Saccharibacillus qingshengii]
MNITHEQSGDSFGAQAYTFELGEHDTAHVLHPQQVIAYRGNPKLRSDRLLEISRMMRKRKLIRADFRGECAFTAVLPAGFGLQTLHISGGSDMLYDFRQLFFYTEGIEMKSRILKLKNMLITQDAIKMKFSGEGQIGIMTQGTVFQVELHEKEPLYVNAGSILAYPENARLDLAVYGNHLASQHMNYHWKMTGRGHVLLQAGGTRSQELREHMEDDGLVKRILREAIPFGNVFIK